jgi:hypothetical protein
MCTKVNVLGKTQILLIPNPKYDVDLCLYNIIHFSSSNGGQEKPYIVVSQALQPSAGYGLLVHEVS